MNPGPAASDPLERPTILAVDDTPENLDVLTGLLQPAYRVRAAVSGERALRIAASDTPPDLVLLDVMMPEMDGFEVCRRLKADAKTRDIPVIFLTAMTEKENTVRGLELGAVDYVTKPFSPPELLARVDTHLALKAAREKLEHLAEKLSKYLSPQVYASIFSGEKEVRIESYRRPLTILFSDIVNFTPRTESLDHLELTDWLNHYLNEMAGIVLRHGGTLDKFIGDAIMVFFGDPKSLGQKEDAVNCVRMAADMRDAAKRIGVDVRIGISSGECTVGNFGSEDRMDYTIIGKEVNAAARLEKSSSPGRILISQFTHDLVKDAVRCEPREELHVKGIDRNIMTYWVADDSAGPQLSSPGGKP